MVKSKLDNYTNHNGGVETHSQKEKCDLKLIETVIF